MIYQPYDSKKLPRYEGMKSFMRLPYVEEMPEGVDFAIVGVPIDGASTFETGQRMGPAWIRNASVNCRGYNPEFGVTLFPGIQGVDFGDAPMLPGYIEECYDNTEKKLDEVYKANAIPICLGGDHSVTLPLLRAAAKKYGKIGLIHFDAHYDNNKEYFGKIYNHATWVYNGVKEGLLDPNYCLQIGMRGPCFITDRQNSIDLGIETITAEEMREMGLPAVMKKMQEKIGDRKYFLSFDIDFVDPAFAPGTGTIEPGGFTSAESLQLMRCLKKLDMIGMDLVEVLPCKDPSGITATLSAYIIFEALSMIAWRKEQKK